MQKSAIEIVEVSPRDGLQNESTVLSPNKRAELIVRAARAGFRRIEAVSFVNPKRVPQMADAEAVVDLARDRLANEGLAPKLVGLALNETGFRRALACGLDEINGVVVASETFNHRNQNATIAETMEQLARMAELVLAADARFSLTIAASFGCPFEGETDADLVAKLAAQGAALGAFEIALADTIGVASPADVSHRLQRAQDAVARNAAASDVQWRCHFHNTRNTGLANVVAAIDQGVCVVDASIGGIGGCPFAPAATGNVPTEDVHYMLNRMGHATGLDLDMLIATAEWLDAQLENSPPGMVWRAGGFPALAPQ